MGEIADDMINGQSCSGCGIYFTQAHGHQAYCADCYKDLPKNEKIHATKAYFPELGEEDEGGGQWPPARNVRSHACTQCTKSFDTPEALYAHVRDKHNPKRIKPHACTQCARSFNTPEGLVGHIRDKHAAKVQHVDTSIINSNASANTPE